MRYALLLATLAAALAASPAFAGNGNGNGQDKKAPTPSGESQPTLVSGPTPIDPASIPSEATAGTVALNGAVPTTTSCGACMNTCWNATTRSGPSDWSGHVYIYQHLTWCGNGAAITYGSAWQSYDQSGWYTISSTYGPWFSGGCVGCYTLRASGKQQ